jgi:3-dehydroquinate dehydratase
MSSKRSDQNEEITQITSTMAQVAKSMNAQFVVDPQKAQDFLTAVRNRQRRKEQSARAEAARTGAFA